jgi:hypothetical protein
MNAFCILRGIAKDAGGSFAKPLPLEDFTTLHPSFVDSDTESFTT